MTASPFIGMEKNCIAHKAITTQSVIAHFAIMSRGCAKKINADSDASCIRI
jgi:hypothetical protein